MIHGGRRLAVIAILSVLFLPLVGEAQHTGRTSRIGVTLIGSAPNPYAAALQRGLAELGWVEGQNILIEYRYADGQRERFPH